MPDEEPSENQEEDEFERRFREIEEKAKNIVDRAKAPEVPHPRAKPVTVERVTSERRETPQVSRGLGLAFAVGYSFVGPLLAGIIIGSLVDGRVGGTWTIVGVLVGTVAAFVLLIRLVNKLND